MANEDIKIILSAVDNTKASFSQLEQRFDSLKTRTSSVFKSMQDNWLAVTAVIASVSVVTDKLIFSYANAGDEIRDMSLRTGIATEALSELKYVADLSGTSIDDFEKGMKKLSLSMSEASMGGESQREIFKHLGIEYKTASGELRAIDDVFMDSIDAINSLGSETEKAAMAQKLFGKAGTELLPMIKEGKAGIQEMREEAQRLGIVFSQDMADAADEFNDNMTKLGRSVDGLTYKLSKHLVPAITDFLSLFTEGTQENAAWQLERIENEISSIQSILKEEGIVGKFWNKLFLSDEEKGKLETDLKELLAKRQGLFERFFGVVPAGKPSATASKITEKAAPIVDIDTAKNDYKTIETLHGIAVDNMKAKSQELKDFEKEYRDYRIESQKMILDIQNAGKEEEIDPYTDYYKTITELQNKQRDADKLSGEERLKLLQEVQKGWQDISGIVQDGEQTIISSQTAQGMALTNILQLDRDINAEYEKGYGALTAQHDKWYEIKLSAEETLNNINAQINDLNNQEVILKLDTTEAEKKIKAIKSQIDNLNVAAAAKSIDAELANMAKYNRSSAAPAFAERFTK